ncbi:MAG TPA: proline racemase family protein [Solirubrobacterales bacterium]|nr:proline racemase family protein [Solirubrobacterales bacterium]
MRSRRLISTVESHTEGMATRMVIGGVEPIAGETMRESLATAAREHADLHGLLVLEPRGHLAMTAAILQAPRDPAADVGVIFVEASGFLPMCGHAAIGVATSMVETGMLAVSEPTTVVRLDTAAGLVAVSVAVSEGRARSATLTNVPSFLAAGDCAVQVPGVGEVRYDLAFGGNFYPIVEAASLGLELRPEAGPELVRLGREIAAAVDAEPLPAHPETGESGTRYTQFVGPALGEADSRSVVVGRSGYFDRSPCGTGTSARVAQLAAAGELAVGQEFVNESLIGSHFVARIEHQTEVGGLAAVVPSITARAWITGHHQFLLDPEDPFPSGISF